MNLHGAAVMPLDLNQAREIVPGGSRVFHSEEGVSLQAQSASLEDLGRSNQDSSIAVNGNPTCAFILN